MRNRELYKKEKVAIRRLIVSKCANFVYETGCLPLDGNCYMLGKSWTGDYCKYFRNAVLPLNPVLEISMTGLNRDATKKQCLICGMAFIAVKNKTYCSDACRLQGQREKDRIRQQRHRQRGQGQGVTILGSESCDLQGFVASVLR